jgi:riboflavin biosynthesis pyrimidine reductase
MTLLVLSRRHEERTLIITNVMAVSLDGRIASYPNEPDADRRQLGFTNDDDHQHLLRLLATTDAVIVGSSSIKASGGAFEGLNDKGQPPIWAVLTNQGLPAGQKFYQQESLTRWLISSSPLTLPPHRGSVRNIVYGRASPAMTVVKALQAAGVERALLFGGASVNKEFYSEGLVDRLIVTVCPLIIAKSSAVPLVEPELPDPIQLRLTAFQPMGNLVVLSYDLIKRTHYGLTRSD